MGTEEPKRLVEDKEARIPFDKLKQPDPILFFDDVVLYEDELADNGSSFLSVKIRVMKERLLMLMRLYLRVDDVIFRIRDCRVYVEFATGLIIRDYTAKEASYDRVKAVGLCYRNTNSAITYE